MRVSHASQLNDDSKLISMMSPMIEGEVAVATNRRWLNRVWYFRDLDSSMEGRYFTVALAKKLVIRAYMATERLPIGQLYILRRGLCVKMWRFLGGGHTWGEDIILDNAELVDHSQAVALTYLECFTLIASDMKNRVECTDEDPPRKFPRVERESRLAGIRRKLPGADISDERGPAPSVVDAFTQIRLMEEAVEDRFALLQVQVVFVDGGCQKVDGCCPCACSKGDAPMREPPKRTAAGTSPGGKDEWENEEKDPWNASREKRPGGGPGGGRRRTRRRRQRWRW